MRPWLRRLHGLRRLVPAAAAAILAGALLIAPAGTVRRAQAINYCNLATYWCVWIDLSGNGTANFVDSEWFDGTAHPDSQINCHREGGTTSGSCLGQFNVGFNPPASIVVYVEFSAAAGSQACYKSSCTQTISSELSVSASTTITDYHTNLVNPETLTAQKTGSGGGSVTSSPRGIDCGTKCQADYAYGTSVTLSAVADASSTFTGWGSPCSGTGSCIVNMTGPVSVQAHFASNATPAPTPAPTPTHAPPPTPTPKPTPTSAPASTATPAPTATPPSPGGSGTPATQSPVSSTPGATPAPGSSESVTPGVSAQPASSESPEPSSAPTSTSSGGGDNTGIVLAILAAGVFIGIGLAIGLRRQRSASP